MPDEPTVNAWQMELVLTMWQAPHCISYLKVLKEKREDEIQRSQNQYIFDMFIFNFKVRHIDMLKIMKMTNLKAHHTANSLPHIIHAICRSDTNQWNFVHRFPCHASCAAGIKNIDGFHQWRVHCAHLLDNQNPYLLLLMYF